MNNLKKQNKTVSLLPVPGSCSGKGIVDASVPNHHLVLLFQPLLTSPDSDSRNEKKLRQCTVFRDRYFHHLSLVFMRLGKCSCGIYLWSFPWDTFCGFLGNSHWDPLMTTSVMWDMAGHLTLQTLRPWTLGLPLHKTLW